MPPEHIPNVDDLITEDDTPVDNIYSEKQQRLLTEPLYSSWNPGRPFLAVANVGLFYAIRQPPLVPDALLSLDVETPADFKPKKNRSYFMWEYGKAPEAVIEIVSNKEGGETTDKMLNYAQIGILYYAIYDPFQKVQEGALKGLRAEGQELCALPGGVAADLESGPDALAWSIREHRRRVAALVRSRRSRHPDRRRTAEQERQHPEQANERAEQAVQRSEQAVQRSEQERQRAEQERQLRRAGKPSAEQAGQLAEQERQQAEQERQRADRLAAQLRELGLQFQET